jgi:predicted signal transduction protein with EAL and GGDEF domain/FixJ family two-component response regulator
MPVHALAPLLARPRGDGVATAGARILVVDDDPTARLLMQAALARAGFEAQMADGGEAALARFDAQPFDMVMLDVDMPGLSGHAVCAQLRRRAGDLLPIVMVTGKDDVASVERAYDGGATDFISKPINLALLGHRVRYLMRSFAAQRDLRTADARNAAMLSAIPDTLLRIDGEGRVLEVRVPPEARRYLPVPEAGQPLARGFGVEAARLLEAARAACACGADQQLEFSLRDSRGTTRYHEVRVACIDGTQSLLLMRDITTRREAEQRVARLAYLDSLTGLPNRPSFMDRLGREVRRAQHGGTRLGVLFLDLDGFKQVNDTMGHDMGDQVLLHAADRLRDALRPSDLVSRALPLDAMEADADADDEMRAALARLGGDEFTVLLPDVGEPEDALRVARRIGERMRRPFLLAQGEVTLSASIGIALYPDDGADAQTLLMHADTAMYHAKRSGRDNAQLYSKSLTEQAQRKLALDSSLRGAEARGEFLLHYQPQIDAVSGRVTSVEALLRWQHPTRGLVSPLEFVPLAEENGLIASIGRWVLRTACADLAAWRAQGLDLRVAVNLSAKQFRDPTLVPTVLETLAAHALSARRLELEVTESAVMENSDATQAKLQTLSAAGVRIALDDFGTGYSSLSYLTRMPIHTIKIDRSFVARLRDDAQSEAVVRAILAMAASLDLEVVAEGVETAAQAETLRALACDGLQGYLFSRPVPADAVPALAARAWPPRQATFAA